MTAGTAPAWSAQFDDNTNRIIGYSFDANGNQLTTPDGATLSYDADNRMKQFYRSDTGNEYYQYSPGGTRVWKAKDYSTSGFGVFYLYGPKGQLLIEKDTQSGGSPNEYVYFGGRLLQTTNLGSAFLYQDRLGSNRTSTYYPFGGEVTTTTNDQPKFAGTYRDITGLDYSINRYYSSSMGRFLTADPYSGSATLAAPQSFNRYAYVGNDPVNDSDPTGLFYGPPPPVPPPSPPSEPDEDTIAVAGMDAMVGGPYYKGGHVSAVNDPNEQTLPGDPRGPRAMKQSFYDQYGKKFNDCISQEFGADAKDVDPQTLANAAIIDASKTSQQVGAIGHVAKAYGESDPNKGPNGTVYIASEYFRNSDPLFVFATYAHELANILDIKMNGPGGMTYGDPTLSDHDTGASVENCMFGGLVDSQGKLYH